MRTFRFFLAAILGFAALSISAPTTLEERVAHPEAVREITAAPDTVGCSFKNKRSEAAGGCDINN